MSILAQTLIERAPLRAAFPVEADALGVGAADLTRNRLQVVQQGASFGAKLEEAGEFAAGRERVLGHAL